MYIYRCGFIIFTSFHCSKTFKLRSIRCYEAAITPFFSSSSLVCAVSSAACGCTDTLPCASDTTSLAPSFATVVAAAGTVGSVAGMEEYVMPGDVDILLAGTELAGIMDADRFGKLIRGGTIPVLKAGGAIIPVVMGGATIPVVRGTVAEIVEISRKSNQMVIKNLK